jgi:hypothetical protein
MQCDSYLTVLVTESPEKNSVKQSYTDLQLKHDANIMKNSLLEHSSIIQNYNKASPTKFEAHTYTRGSPISH